MAISHSLDQVIAEVEALKSVSPVFGNNDIPVAVKESVVSITQAVAELHGNLSKLQDDYARMMAQVSELVQFKNNLIAHAQAAAQGAQ